MSNFKFSMSEEDLAKSISTIPATVAQFRKTVQECSVAAVEYAIVKTNGTYINNIIEAIPAKYQPTLRMWVSQKGIPLKLDTKTKTVAFNFAKAKAILKERGTEWNPDANKLSEEDGTCLERLADMAHAQLSNQSWDDQLKAAQKENSTKKEVTAADLKKSVNRLAKKAIEAGIGLDEIGVVSSTDSTEVPSIPEGLQEILDTILPYAKDEDAVVKITMAIASAVSQLNHINNKQAAA